MENLLKSTNFKISAREMDKLYNSLLETEVDNLSIKVELKTQSGLYGKLDRLKKWILNNHNNEDLQPSLINLWKNMVKADHEKSRFKIIELLLGKMIQNDAQDINASES